MTTNLNDLGSTPLNDGVDPANLPAQMGSSAPPPQPGPYRFRLAPVKLADLDTVKHDDYGQRVKATLALTIVQSSTGAENGETWTTTLTNTPMRRGKRDDPNAPLASDWDYLNQALGITLAQRSNKGYAEALMAKTAGGDAEFLADLEWSWRCSDTRDAYFADDQGNAQKAEGTKGCGAKYYQSGVSKEAETGPDGQIIRQVYPLQLTCSACGALVRAFGNLRNFRA